LPEIVEKEMTGSFVGKEETVLIELLAFDPKEMLC